MWASTYFESKFDCSQLLLNPSRFYFNMVYPSDNRNYLLIIFIERQLLFQALFEKIFKSN